MTVIIDDDQVSFLEELAEELAGRRSWKRFDVVDDAVLFTSREGYECRVDTTGFAMRRDKDGDFEEYDEENVVWDDEFDEWSNHVWANLPDGTCVMIHD